MAPGLTSPGGRLPSGNEEEKGAYGENGGKRERIRRGRRAGMVGESWRRESPWWFVRRERRRRVRWAY